MRPCFLFPFSLCPFWASRVVVMVVLYFVLFPPKKQNGKEIKSRKQEQRHQRWSFRRTWHLCWFSKRKRGLKSFGKKIIIEKNTKNNSLALVLDDESDGGDDSTEDDNTTTDTD